MPVLRSLCHGQSSRGRVKGHADPVAVDLSHHHPAPNIASKSTSRNSDNLDIYRSAVKKSSTLSCSLAAAPPRSGGITHPST